MEPFVKLQHAREALEKRQPAEAERILSQLLAENPQFPEAWRLRGLLLQAVGQFAAAAEAHRRALTLVPQWAEEWNDLGICYAQQNLLLDAAEAFQRGVLLKPEHVGLACNLARGLCLLGRREDAERALLNAIRLAPTDGDLHFQLGKLLREKQRYAEAQVSLGHALQFSPQHVEAKKQLAGMLFDQGETEVVLKLLREAEQLAPRDGEIQNDLGNAYRQLERYEEATVCYRRALELAPQLHAAHANLANLLSEASETQPAQSAYDQAFQLLPVAKLRVLRDLCLPLIYDSHDHLKSTRAEFSAAVQKLLADGVRIDADREIMPTHFYLAYHGLNDRDLHAQLGQIPKVTPVPLPKRPRREKLKVGIASRHLRNHTIGNLNHRIVEGLGQHGCEVVLLTVGANEDLLTRRMQQAVAQHVVLPTDIATAARLIREQALDVLFYTDLGMDVITFTLAFHRLAPVQCCTWGHPVTIGSPEMDYFISADTAEIPGAQAHYLEQLVRFPRLNVVYERPNIPPQARNRGFFDFPEQSHLYVCPQTLFKFHPDFDAILMGILEQDPQGLLVLIEGKYPAWREKLLARWKRILPNVERRVRFLPKLSREDFMRLSATADVLLDTVHFSGGNTSYEAFAMGTPVVTMPSELLRARLTHAMYQQMGLPELSVNDGEAYLQLALKLGTNADYQQHLRREIAERCPVLFEDRAILTEFANFFRKAVAERAN